MAEHVSTKRWQDAEDSLLARITVLQEIADTRQLPSDFPYHRSNRALMSWQDDELNITKVGVNTARDSHPESWSVLQGLRNDLARIELETSEPANDDANMSNGRRKSSPSARAHSDCPSCQTKTDELIMLRTSYLELLDHLSLEDIQSKLLRDAIRRHAKHKGLKSILNDRESK